MDRSVVSITRLNLKSRAGNGGNARPEGDARDEGCRYVLSADGYGGHSRGKHPVQADNSTTIDGSPGARRTGRKNKGMTIALSPAGLLHPKGASVASLSAEDVVDAVRHHPVLCMFSFSLLFFMGVEYTLHMVPSSSPPLDIGFLLTRSLHELLAARPALNSALAALNTVFVGMQTAYILWAWLVEGRPRPTISALFMFTCRGILGYSTQLPLPQGFLGSGMDFPVANVSFFLFFSGHVAGSVIASMDMRRMKRPVMAWTFDALNILQGLRLLVTRGHYTIDLAAGAGAGFLFDILAGKYEESKKHNARGQDRARCTCLCQRPLMPSGFFPKTGINNSHIPTPS